MLNIAGNDFEGIRTSKLKELLAPLESLQVLYLNKSKLDFIALLYRYRWHIRLVMYEAVRGDPQGRWRQRRQGQFQYDLFVCYDSEDSDWVLQHLVHALEDQMGLRLCLHEYDFILGKNITDNIMDSLAASKRVLAIFSPNFAESDWCNFELRVCMNHVVESDDVMVIVILEEVPARDMSGAMRALMKTTTYIKWNNDPEAITSFWRLTCDEDGQSFYPNLLSLDLFSNRISFQGLSSSQHQWVVYDPNVFDRHNFSCVNIPGTSLRAFFLNEQKCLLSHNASVLIITFVAVFIAGLAFVTTFYRYGWLVRLVVYEAFRRDPEARWRQRRPEDFQYDLFVSYSSEDSRWVHEHLVPVLEQDMGIRLCLHQRDFDPRKPVMKNIMDCLEVSKRVLVLLSPSFAEDKECNFQLDMCLTHTVEGDDVMVIVILEEVPPRDMSGAMRALMKTTTYIEWNDDPEAIASFWRRMTLALVDILPGVNH
nr:hypothetical protein BaRGS_000499 [Batillaria attramentaria]